MRKGRRKETRPIAISRAHATLQVTTRKKVKQDRPTDRPTDRRTDTVTCRVACTRLKISNFCNLVNFNRRSIKLSTHILSESEVPNRTISIFLAQPTKRASYRDYSKCRKCDIW